MTIPSVGSKSTLVTVKVKDPAGKTYTIASDIKVRKNKSFQTPILKFSKVGKFTVTITYGTVKRKISITAKK